MKTNPDPPIELPLAEERPVGQVAHPALIAGLVATVAALIWFLLRLSPGVTFGPWLGPLLDARYAEGTPILSAWLSAAALRLPFLTPCARLNVLSAIFGALACGMLAAATAFVARRVWNSLDSLVCGFVTGALFAASPDFCHAGIAAGPSTLTIFFALSSLLALIVYAGESSGRGWLYVAALSAGLAAANEPFLLMLGMMAIVFGALVSPYDSWRDGLVVVLALVVFAAAAALPFAGALARGESMHRVFSHAFLQAYPQPAEGGPEPGYWMRTAEILSPFVLLVSALPGLLFMLRRPTRRFAFLCVAIVLFFGSLLPALTDRFVALSALRGSSAPRLITIAAVCMFVGWGIAGLAQWESRQPPQLKHARWGVALDKGLVFLSMGLLVSTDVWNVPVRSSAIAERVGKRILDACPEGTLLLSGDSYTTSLAVAVQRELGYREDVGVVPIFCFARLPLERDVLETLLGERATLPEVFPPEHAEEKWPSEQPVLFARFLAERKNHPPTPTALRDLAIWEFVKENYMQVPLCFVGFSSPWLAPRARISGLTLAYPRFHEPPYDASGRAFRFLYSSTDSADDDPYLGRTVTAMLQPLTQAARRQDMLSTSLELAMPAMYLDSVWPQVEMIRWAARHGDKEEAFRYAAEYLKRADSDTEDLQTAITEELDAYAREVSFLALVNAESSDEPDLDARAEMAARLWEADELSVLAFGYSRILERSPEDADALYQLAAAYTQLGDLAQARDMLERWLNCAGLHPQAAAEHLHKDGRFVLLRHYQSEGASPP